MPYLKIDQINLFYKETGHGRPLILLHGNGGSHKDFKKILNALSKDFHVFALDNLSHGKTTKKINLLSYHIMKNHVRAFAKALNLKEYFTIGYSDGAIVSLLLSMEDENLKKQVLIGTNLTPDGLTENFKNSLQEKVKEKSPSLFKNLKCAHLKREKLSLMLNEPNISFSDLTKVKAKSLILFGENDLYIKKEDSLTMASTIPDSELVVFHNAPHSVFEKKKDKIKFLNITLAFLLNN